MQQRYVSAERRSLQEHQRMTSEYRRSAAACSNLQAKLRRFQDLESAKLREV